MYFRSTPSAEPPKDLKYTGILDYRDHKSSKKKKKNKDKSWKSKHKNVIDPVFISQVELLTQDLASMQVKMQNDFLT